MPEWLSANWYMLVLVGLGLLAIGYALYQQQRPDPTKKKFVVTGGCLGCLVVIGIIGGAISALLGIVVHLRDLVLR